MPQEYEKMEDMQKCIIFPMYFQTKDEVSFAHYFIRYIYFYTTSTHACYSNSIPEQLNL